MKSFFSVIGYVILALVLWLLWYDPPPDDPEEKAYNDCVENKIEEGMKVLRKNAEVSFSNHEILRRDAIKRCIHLLP